MQFLIAHKEYIMAGLAVLAFEVIPRAKPGWKPVTKLIYDIIGKVMPDKQVTKKLK